MIVVFRRPGADCHEDEIQGMSATSQHTARQRDGVVIFALMAALVGDPPGRNQSGAVFLSLTCLSVMSVNSLSGPDAP